MIHAPIKDVAKTKKVITGKDTTGLNTIAPSPRAL
jgi:hypothetical protein